MKREKRMEYYTKLLENTIKSKDLGETLPSGSFEKALSIVDTHSHYIFDRIFDDNTTFPNKITGTITMYKLLIFFINKLSKETDNDPKAYNEFNFEECKKFIRNYLELITIEIKDEDEDDKYIIRQCYTILNEIDTIISD